MYFIDSSQADVAQNSSADSAPLSHQTRPESQDHPQSDTRSDKQYHTYHCLKDWSASNRYPPSFFWSPHHDTDSSQEQGPTVFRDSRDTQQASERISHQAPSAEPRLEVSCNSMLLQPPEEVIDFRNGLVVVLFFRHASKLSLLLCCLDVPFEFTENDLCCDYQTIGCIIRFMIGVDMMSSGLS